MHLGGTRARIEVPGWRRKEIVDPGPGKHLWTVIGMWMVDPRAGQVMLDLESLFDLRGPGCYKCEREYNAALAASPCVGWAED